jgi:predicted tellurium resistance membrane protein TerC
VIIAWVGIKLLVEYLHSMHYVEFAIPKWLSLSLIVVIFAVAFFQARRQEKAARRTPVEESAAAALLTGK